MKNNIETILAECIDKVRAGSSSPAECLKRYPSLRQELEPLLNIAINIQKVPVCDLSPSAKYRIKARLNAQIRAPREIKSGFKLSDFSPRYLLSQSWMKAAALSIVVLFGLSAIGAGTAFASSESLPGEVLYSAKIAIEHTRQFLTINNNASVSLELTFAGRRLAETEALNNAEPSQLDIALKGYERNIDEALITSQKIGSGNRAKGLETIASAISGHLLIIDNMQDSLDGDVQKYAIQLQQTAFSQYAQAIRLLAEQDAVKAAEIHIETEQNRLSRAENRVASGDFAGAEQALLQFRAMFGLCEEITLLSEEQGVSTQIKEIYAKASSVQLTILMNIRAQARGNITASIEETIDAISAPQQHGEQGGGVSKDNPPETPLSGEQNSGENSPSAGMSEQAKQPESPDRGNTTDPVGPAPDSGQSTQGSADTGAPENPIGTGIPQGNDSRSGEPGGSPGATSGGAQSGSGSGSSSNAGKP